MPRYKATVEKTIDALCFPRTITDVSYLERTFIRCEMVAQRQRLN
jgi:hypothetical protein